MKIEKLNETQVRVTLDKADLVEREIKISELAYGSEKAQKLFKDMMKRAFEEFGFEASNVPLMIEAVPLSTESIMIIVTKVSEPDELEDRLAHLTPNKNVRKFKRKEEEHLDSSENHDDFEEMPEEWFADLDAPEEEERPSYTLFAFKNLDDIIHASYNIQDDSFDSSLYKDTRRKRFLLLVKDDKKLPTSLEQMLLEYGEQITSSKIAEGYLVEHAELMIKEKALDKLQLI